MFFRGHPFGQLSMPFGKENSGIARNQHCLQFLLPVGGLGVVDKVQLTQALLNAGFHVKQTLAIHLAVHRRMTGGALLHELGENTGMVGFLPFFRHMIEDALTLRLSLPIGNDHTLVGVNVGLRDVIRLQLTRVKRMKVFHRVACQLRKRGHSLRLRAALANNQLVGSNIDCLLFTYFIEILGPEHRRRQCSIVLLVELGLDERPLNGERCRRVEALLAQTTYAVVHAAVVFWILHHVLLHLFLFFCTFPGHAFSQGIQCGTFIAGDAALMGGAGGNGEQQQVTVGTVIYQLAGRFVIVREWFGAQLDAEECLAESLVTY